MKRRYKVTMHCEHCEKAVKSALSELSGVEELKVELKSNLVELQGKVTDEQVIKVIEELGYQIEKLKEVK
jgi:copper chaperone